VAATAALAVFAGVQVTREIVRSRQRRAAIARRLTVAAWLARRSCEATLRAGTFHDESPHRLAFNFSAAAALDRLQEHFRQVLDLSSEVGGEDAEAGRRAFEGFLATADRFGEIVVSAAPTRFAEVAERALLFLHDAVVDLERFAPRREHEPALPSPEKLKRVKPVMPPPIQSPPASP